MSGMGIRLPIIVVTVVLIGLVSLLLGRSWDVRDSSVSDSNTPQPSYSMGSLEANSGDRQMAIGGGLDAIFTPTPIPDKPLATSRELSLLSVRGEDGDDGAEKLALALLVCDAFPLDRRMCSGVVWSESLSGGSGCTWRPVVYGPCWSGTRDCGLLQTNEIHRWRYEALGWEMDIDCWVPERNIVVAVWIYEDQGPCAWSSYGC